MSRLLNLQMQHGLQGSAEHKVWVKMRSRCNNPNSKDYRHYGARGIKVCERWRFFKHFLADVGRRPPGAYTLDRINNDGWYEPGNCRWATKQQQQRNTRNNRLVSFRGESKPMIVWAEQFALPYEVVRNRLRIGWTAEKALTTPYLGRHYPRTGRGRWQVREVDVS